MIAVRAHRPLLLLAVFVAQVAAESLICSLVSVLPSSYWQLVILLILWPAALFSALAVVCLWDAGDATRSLQEALLEKAFALQRCAWLFIAASAVIWSVV